MNWQFMQSTCAKLIRIYQKDCFNTLYNDLISYRGMIRSDLKRIISYYMYNLQHERQKSLEIDEVYAEKIKVKVYANQQNSVS